MFGGAWPWRKMPVPAVGMLDGRGKRVKPRCFRRVSWRSLLWWRSFDAEWMVLKSDSSLANSSEEFIFLEALRESFALWECLLYPRNTSLWAYAFNALCRFLNIRTEMRGKQWTTFKS